MKDKNISNIIIIVILLILITAISTYAYFTGILIGDKATNITVNGGNIEIFYNAGSDINVTNIIPSNNHVLRKTFSIIGNNTTNIIMNYKLNLIIESNTFSEKALKYKLTSINNDNNGTTIPSSSYLIDIGNTNQLELGTGSFTSPTDGYKKHTYHLEIFFPNANYDQNIEQGKELKSKIIIADFQPIYLRNVILFKNGGISAIEKREVKDSQSGMFATLDNDGTSYYYRGVNELNNNLLFDGFKWKIIRINGDHSIRIIYNGIDNQSKTNIKLESYNTQIKDILNTWYQNNILTKSIVEESIFCNTKTDENLICQDKTISTVGLLTLDEALLAGLNEDDNTNNYLNYNQKYWTMTSYNKDNNYIINNNQITFNNLNNQLALRPVINLSLKTTVTGEGTITNPYKVIN